MRFINEVSHRLLARVKQANWKKIGLITGGSLVLVLLIIQLFYPSDRLLPFTNIENQAVGGEKKTDVTTRLNKAYAEHQVAVYMGSGKKPVVSPALSVMDISVDNTARVESFSYPWYLRLVPTSLFWANFGTQIAPAPTFGNKFAGYVESTLMKDCRQAPVDASLKANGAALEVVSAITGGTCEQAEVVASIKKVRPALTYETSVRVARQEERPSVGDDVAKEFGEILTQRLKDGIAIDVLGTPVVASASDVLSWLDFASSGSELTVSVNAERAGAWLGANVAGKVAIAPGVSYITTLDFTELSRANGSTGRALNVTATAASVESVVKGEAQTATASMVAVPPTEQYTRTYSASDKGLSALLANYAKDHPGTFGISLVELDGKKRRADYNGDKQFVTASTYKLFVAYSLLKQIDAGKRDWSSNEACFNKMISQSDNPCSESFLNSLGLANVTKDIQAIGLKNSTFMKTGGPFTTANDLTLLLGMIATSQNFSSVNQQRLVAAMKANVYRKGIPAGAAGTVADKVGFLEGLLHDAAIVYGPKGTYVLATMTDGSSWATIADLAKQIDTLRSQ